MRCFPAIALVTSCALFACSPMPAPRGAPSSPEPASKAPQGDAPLDRPDEVHVNPEPSAVPSSPLVPPEVSRESPKKEQALELDHDSPGAVIVGNVGLTREDIARVVQSHKAEVRLCYDAALRKKPDARGKLSIAMTIDASGAVSDAAVQSSSFDGPDVGDCVVKHVRTFRFPAPDGGQPVKVTYPYVFAP